MNITDGGDLDRDRQALDRLVSKVNNGAIIDRCFDMLIRAPGNKNKCIRRDVVSTLGKLPISNNATRESKRIDRLIQTLGDEDYSVREAAAHALGRLASKMNNNAIINHYFDTLIQAMKNEDSNVRKAAAASP